MSSDEYIPTGHRIFRGKKRIEGELAPKEMKPFIIEQLPRTDAIAKAEDETDHAAEDIAARIACDRMQFQAYILAQARKEAGEDAEGNPVMEDSDAIVEDAEEMDAPEKSMEDFTEDAQPDEEDAP